MKIPLNIAMRHYQRCMREYACQLYNLSQSEMYIHTLINGKELSTFEEGLREIIEEASLR